MRSARTSPVENLATWSVMAAVADLVIVVAVSWGALGVIVVTSGLVYGAMKLSFDRLGTKVTGVGGLVAVIALALVDAALCYRHGLPRMALVLVASHLTGGVAYVLSAVPLRKRKRSIGTPRPRGARRKLDG